MSNINLLETKPLCSAKNPSSEKVSEDNNFHKTAHKLAPRSAITCVYRARVVKHLCEISVTWCKIVANYSLTITLEKPSNLKESPYTCKIDLTSTQIWGKKGLKSFQIDETRVDLFWDFREVKFTNTPEPCSNFYLTLVCDKEIVLLLGDLKNEACKRTKAKMRPEEATLLRKKESVCGKRLFCTRAMLNGSEKEHDIVIENSLSGPGDPEMWINVEGTTVIRIMNLNWRFRGNETVMVNNVPIQIFWDVHDWLFNNQGSSHALFIFKKGAIDSINTDSCVARNSNELCSSNGNACEEFCHFLHAWKIE